MRVLKKIGYCVLFLLTMGQDLVASSDFLQSFIKRSSRTYSTQLAQGIFRRTRPCLCYNHEKGVGTFTLSSNGVQDDSYEKFKSIINQCRLLLQQVETGKEKFSRKEPLKPVRAESLTLPTKPLRTQDSLPKEDISTPTNQGEVGKYQNSLRTVEDAQEYFVRRIMISAKNSQKINPSDVKSILDLYAALVHHSKDRISRVLSCQTDTSKSSTYNDVVDHVESKGADLDTYRKIYVKLCKAFGEDAMRTVYRTAARVMKEKERHIATLLIQAKSQKDYISLIVEGANPLYPVHPGEVKDVIELYDALAVDKPRDVITRVLNSQTNNSKSVAYKAVMSYIKQRDSDLDTYRNIYGRLTKSLDKESMKIIYRMFDKKIHIREDFKQTSTLEMAENLAPGVTSNLNGGLNRGAHENNDEEIQLSNPITAQKLDKTESAKPSQPNSHSDRRVKLSPVLPITNVTITSPVLHEDHFSKPTLKTGGKRNNAAMQNQERLNRVYALLPEFKPRSITWVLSGKTKSSSVPVWREVNSVIERIRQEAIKEGDTTTIDLDYFKRLLIEYPNVTKNIVYSISKRERYLLSRVYALLPNHSPRGITWVLSGKTKHPKVPMLINVTATIGQIKKEELQKGNSDAAKMDLNYFHKLYWAAVRATGNRTGLCRKFSPRMINLM